MTLSDTAAPRRRGPYRKRARLVLADAEWRRGETLMVGRVRWIISSISGGPGVPPEQREVVLRASNTVNHGIQWRTGLSVLPVKPSKENR